ncbi:unnamed protein product, partial [Meganyctiphanes norvegica]
VRSIHIDNMASTSVLQCLVTIACVVLATQAAAPQSYRSIQTVLSNRVSAHKLPAKCEPSCEGHTADHVRDPSRCDQYWICLENGTRYEQPHVCPPGEIVNTAEPILCEPIINDGSTQCTIPDPECDPSIPKVCYQEDTCPKPDQGIFAYPDEHDCGVYHVCYFGDVDIKCDQATFPYFNGQECVADADQCCKCQAVCNVAWEFIPDPFDCHKYYLCQDLEGSITGGKPYIATDEEMFTCPDSEVFDVDTKHCSDSATCVNICDGSGCLSAMVCVSEGYFPRCTNICDPGFFYCSANSVSQHETVKPQFCMQDVEPLVFDPKNLYCVPPDYCII